MNNTDYDSYLKQLDDMDIFLTQEEENDLAEIVRLSESVHSQDNLGKEIFDTIEKAAIDSIAQIVNLSDIGDWRPDQGAVVTTPLNFENEVFACEADKKRFEMREDRTDGRWDVNEYRKRAPFNNAYNQAKQVHLNSTKRNDGSFTDAYTGKTLYCTSDERNWHIDENGQQKHDTTTTINVDHIYSVAGLSRDPKLALYSSDTQEEFEKDLSKVANNKNNFANTSEHINKSMRDKDTLEYAKEHPDKEMDLQKVREETHKANQAKTVETVKMAVKNQSVPFVKGMAKSAVAATEKKLVGETLTISVQEFFVEFRGKKVSDDGSLLDRIKRVFSNIWRRVKEELSHIWKTIAEFATNNAASEIANLVVNFFFSTAKNIFKLIRCMMGSILRAFKIIADSKRPMKERIFEALKVISSGLAFAAGAALNEVLDKAITTNLPFLAPISSEISAVISGLVSSILSALVLMAFDKHKDKMKFRTEQDAYNNLLVKSAARELTRTAISDQKTAITMFQTVKFIEEGIAYMAVKRDQILDNFVQIEDTNLEIKELALEVDTSQAETCLLLKQLKEL